MQDRSVHTGRTVTILLLRVSALPCAERLLADSRPSISRPSGAPFPPPGPRTSCRSLPFPASTSQAGCPTSILVFPSPRRPLREADRHPTSRGIDKILHSFDVHLRLRLRCSNGSLNLLRSSRARLPIQFPHQFRLATLFSSEPSTSSPRLLLPSIRRSLNQMATTKI